MELLQLIIQLLLFGLELLHNLLGLLGQNLVVFLQGYNLGPKSSILLAQPSALFLQSHLGSELALPSILHVFQLGFGLGQLLGYSLVQGLVLGALVG